MLSGQLRSWKRNGKITVKDRLAKAETKPVPQRRKKIAKKVPKIMPNVKANVGSKLDLPLEALSELYLLSGLRCMNVRLRSELRLELYQSLELGLPLGVGESGSRLNWAAMTMPTIT